MARAAVRAAANPGATGCGAGGGPSPGISGDRVTAFAEWDRRPCRASRAVAPSSHRSRASAVPPLRAVTPCGGAALRPQAAICYGRAIPAPSCRRVSAASGYRRSYPTPCHCRVRATPGSPGRDSPPAARGWGISSAPSGLRDAPGSGDCGFSQTRGDCLIPLARGGRSVSKAEGSHRLSVAPGDCRYPAAADNRRVPKSPGRRDGSGHCAFPGSSAQTR